MYKRDMYLNRIRPFYDNEQIKVLTGVRRAGKTEILKMIQGELATSTDASHILYLVDHVKRIEIAIVCKIEHDC